MEFHAALETGLGRAPRQHDERVAHLLDETEVPHIFSQLVQDFLAWAGFLFRAAIHVSQLVHTPHLAFASGVCGDRRLRSPRLDHRSVFFELGKHRRYRGLQVSHYVVELHSNDVGSACNERVLFPAHEAVDLLVWGSVCTRVMFAWNLSPVRFSALPPLGLELSTSLLNARFT